jgi:bifunctional DNase/RNase
MMTADKDFKRLVRERATRTGESYVTARRHLLRRRHEEAPLNERLVPVVLEGVVMREVDQLPHFWMSLREQRGTRRLRILIGPEEAAAISMGAQRVSPPRPMTHDTLKQAVDAFGGRPARIEIRHQPGGSVFTADLLVEREPGDPVNLDCRPSDAVALAVRYEPPPEMLVLDSLLEEPAAAEN